MYNDSELKHLVHPAVLNALGDPMTVLNSGSEFSYFGGVKKLVRKTGKVAKNKNERHEKIVDDRKAAHNAKRMGTAAKRQGKADSLRSDAISASAVLESVKGDQKRSAPAPKNVKKDNTLLYAGAGLAIVITIAFFATRGTPASKPKLA